MKPIILLTLFTLLGSCASRSDLSYVDDRVATIEQQAASVQQGQKQLAKRMQDQRAAEERLRDQSAALYASIDRMKEELQAMNGRLEELEHVVRQKIGDVGASSAQAGAQTQRLDQMILDLKKRMTRVEDYLNFEIAGAPAAAVTPAAKSKKTASSKGIYQSALDTFDKGDYAAARSGFEQFLKRYPKTKDADNAQFWIGETYYKEKWYEKAILEYQKVIERFPKGNKVPASLLKQGLSFYNLGDKANARLILKELITRYPKSNEAKIATTKLKGF